jgi:Protein of unknown function (DUF1566)
VLSAGEQCELPGRATCAAGAICDGNCRCPTTTTSSTTSTSSSSTSSTTTSTLPACLADLGETVLDTCTGLEWEKKTNTSGLHAVNIYYAWAGCCDGDCTYDTNLCQPTEAAAAACTAHADGDVLGCKTCASGVCALWPGTATTVWGWVSELNEERFAGHDDWRLPSEGGHNLPPSGTNELETILIAPFVCEIGYTSSCIYPIFGPTEYPNGFYWSASTVFYDSDEYGLARFVGFDFGRVGAMGKSYVSYVRAVRSASSQQERTAPYPSER